MREYQVGDVVEKRYVLRREIARGGGGIVFEAEHRFTTRSVAIKVLSVEQKSQPRVGIRLLQESRALTVARHPNIVEVLDAGVSSDGGPYLVMELLEGRPLDGLLATRGKLTPSDAAWVVARVADGVSKLHRHGLIHRDIKPSNVFITYTDEGEENVTLLDFGAAAQQDVAVGDRVTAENTMIGTPEYMAPEQLNGTLTTDPRIDVYGLGVLLYECVLGEVPHEGTFGTILLKVHTKEPIFRSDDARQLPEELKQILYRAMALESTERFSSAADFAAALRSARFNDGQSVSLLGLPGTTSGEDALTSRRFTRAPYVAPVVMHHEGGKVSHGRSQDISTGGLLILASGDIPTEQIESVSMALPAQGETVRVRVAGRWVQAGRQGTVVGLQFLDLDKAWSENIRSYVARIVARGIIPKARSDADGTLRRATRVDPAEVLNSD